MGGESRMLPECQLASNYAHERFDSIEGKIDELRSDLGDLREFKGEIKAKVTMQATFFGVVGGAIPVIGAAIMKLWG